MLWARVGKNRALNPMMTSREEYDPVVTEPATGGKMPPKDDTSQRKAVHGESPDFEMIVGWGRSPTGEMLPQESLPEIVQVAISSVQRENQKASYSVLAFRTLMNGEETDRSGPKTELPPDQDLLVLSLVDSRVTLDSLRVLVHMVILHKADTRNG